MKNFYIYMLAFSILIVGCNDDSGKKIDSHSVANENGFSQKQAISVAQFILDDAGFHGIDETINSTSTIDSNYQYTVGRVKKIVDGAEWPNALESMASDFSVTLGNFKTALATNSIAEASILATQTHDAQHELSHHIDDWFDTISVEKSEPSVFAVAITQFILDSAGFHDMEDTLTNDQAIDANYQYKVSRVKKILENAIMPSDLESQASELIISMGNFQTALATNNLNDSISYAGEAHDAQHELSHEMNDWLESQTKGNDVAVYNILLAQFVLDSTGFHDMQDTIESTATIDSTYASKVDRARKVLYFTTWPSSLKTNVETFIDTLVLYNAALSANNVSDATTLSATVHDAQHGLSHAIDEWVAKQ